MALVILERKAEPQTKSFILDIPLLMLQIVLFPGNKKR